MAQQTIEAPEAGRSRLWERRIEERFAAPTTSYYLLLGATALLVGTGLVMVLSSSSVEAFASTQSSTGIFLRQLMFAAIGAPLMWLASRVPVATWKQIGWPLLLLALLGQLLVFTPLGVDVAGNRNWLELAGQRVQPSEGAKLALVLWAAAVMARKRPLLGEWAHVLVPVVPIGGLLILLVMIGRDLGTVMILVAILGGVMFAAGAPLRIFGIAVAGVAVAIVPLVMTSPNRMLRVQTWLSGECTDIYSSCWQTTHGEWAFAQGGWWGAGLGGSSEKWSYLPEAHNDFIFAIIGEELGLPGTLVVLILFAAIAVACMRVVRRSDDLFVKLVTAGVMTWVLGQAILNMGVVLGLLPVVGVPLPLVSSGGSSLVATMVGLGVVLSFARREPGAQEALAARPSVVRRSMAVAPSGRARVARVAGSRRPLRDDAR